MTASSHDHSPSLAGRIARVLGWGRDRPARGQDGVSDAPVQPAPLLVMLEAMSVRCGKPATRDMLGATLPTREGDMDPRFAPIAMARAGLDARWEKRRVADVTSPEMPVLLSIRTGGCVLLIARPDHDHAMIRDAAGERTVEMDHLAELVDGDILVCGHVDPENGLAHDEDSSLVRRNPRLWIVGVFLAERRRLVQMMIAALFLNLCGLAVPLYMRAIYDRVVPNLAIESLWALSVGVVIVLLFEFTFKHIRSNFVDAVGVRVGQSVQHRAMMALLQARPGTADRNVGQLSTALRDTEGLAMLMPQAVATFGVDVPYFFAYAALIGMIGGWTVAGPVAGAAGLVLVGLIANYAVKLAAKKTTKLMQARSNLVVDVAEGLTTIKANQAEGRFLRQWDIVADHIGIGGRTARKWNDLPVSASAFLVQLVTVMVVIIGVFQIKAGAMTVGALIAVVMLTGRAMMPVSAAITTSARLNQAMSQFAGLADILALEPEREVSDPAIARRPVRGDIRLAEVGFTYAESTVQSLRSVTLSIQPGEKIALIGRSGSGKSTLLQLLAGMIVPQTGTLTIDGHAAAHYGASHLRSGIAYAGQDAMLFDTTIWDNILLGMEEPGEAVVEAAITASGLDSFVARSVDGYGRKVGQRGYRLSGGQRQSVILARALVRDPRILLLDEPTASMDINSEQAVIAGLARVTRDRTLIVATHRMAVLDIVDRVIWLDDGRIVADRPKTEVMAMLRGAKPAPPASKVA